MDIQKEFEDLKDLIKKESAIARDYFNEDSTENTIKGDGSVVTEVDGKMEAVLSTHIKARFPNDAIIGEEHGEHAGESGFVWHIDPIDGTDNFLRKIPFFCVSVARLGDTIEDSFAIIYNPITGQMFSSIMDEGAYENERLMSLTAEPLGSRHLVSVAAYSRDWMKTAKFALLEALSVELDGYKGVTYSSCALETAYVAANRIDAQLIFELKSWDYAAGLFLVQASGGVISVSEDGKWKRWEGSLKELCAIHGRTIFASHADVHDEILDFIGDPHDWGEK